MNNTLFGFLVFLIPLHLILVIIPLVHTFRAAISTKSKIFWCGLLVFFPLLGVGVFHFKHRIGLFQGRGYERSTAEERASSGTLAPHDDE